MALALRTAANTNINGFLPGDSIFKSATLVAAFQECVERLQSTIYDYNQSNPILPYPAISVNYDNGVCAAAVPVPYDKIAGAKTPVRYLDAYSGWTVPTTGELTGVTTLLAAYLYILEALGDANDVLRPGIVIQSAKPTTVNSDDMVNREYLTSFALPYDTVVSATGVVEKLFQNFHVITDIQQGHPIV